MEDIKVEDHILKIGEQLDVLQLKLLNNEPVKAWLAYENIRNYLAKFLMDARESKK